MTWFLREERGAILEFLSAGGRVQNLLRQFRTETPDWDAIGSLNGDAIFLWRERPDATPSVPAMVVVDDQRDFLAWCSAFIRNYRPFTAFCRVVPLELARTLFAGARQPDPRAYLEAWVGLAMAEAVIGSGLPLDNVPPIACQSTLSYAMARAFASGYGQQGVALVPMRWQRMREVSQQPQRNVSLSEFERAGMMLAEAGHDGARQTTSTPHLRIVDEVRRGGEVSEASWRELVPSQYSVLVRAPHALRGPLERRVEYLEDVLREFAAGRVGGEVDSSFVLGYIASRLGPTFWMHREILRTLGELNPGCPAWYSVLFGLRAEGSVLDSGGGLGLRVARDATVGVGPLSDPVCDVSLDEFEMLKAGPRGMPLRSGQPTMMFIELIPGVVVPARLAHGSYGDAPLHDDVVRQESEFAARESLREVRQLLNRATEILDHRLGGLERDGSRRRRRK